ncbi:unnamed protein product [Phaedon cochleariae]|uniref:FAM86 N-terminal domain-containing protein n=1 Tax=Phaedon cochleariae TaxID=80249 RepID=A0A9P0DMG1_PHACE|nr:unnamed protein product [Phaedon cochleariae]
MSCPVTKEKVEFVTKQFLCNVPLNNFQWNDIFSDLILDEIAQQTLLDSTINSNLVLHLPLPTNYQKSFLKRIIDCLEECRQRYSELKETVICDEIYSAYGRLVAIAVTEDNFKHYMIKDKDKVISLKESNNLISDGTTGLRTWQAALVLSEWIFKNESLFKNETIMELGAGVGLIGLVLRECSPKKIYLTDCHQTVLNNLCKNLKINIDKYRDKYRPDAQENEDSSFPRGFPIEDRCLYHNVGPPDTYVLKLPWEEVNIEECHKLGVIDSIIAADIVYDEDSFVALVGALKCLTESCSVKRVIFSCTERNPETLKSFLLQMNSASFFQQELEIPVQNNFIWPTDTPVKLFSFKRSL